MVKLFFGNQRGVHTGDVQMGKTAGSEPVSRCRRARSLREKDLAQGVLEVSEAAAACRAVPRPSIVRPVPGDPYARARDVLRCS